MKILVLQGPNLNMLGKRAEAHYGSETLDEVHRKMEDHAKNIGCELLFCQSNHEGDLVTRIQEEREKVDGIVINPAGLTGVGYSLRDAIEETYGTAPIIYRAGRYGLGPATKAILHDCGVVIDSSVRALYDYSPGEGGDYSAFPITMIASASPPT